MIVRVITAGTGAPVGSATATHWRPKVVLVERPGGGAMAITLAGWSRGGVGPRTADRARHRLTWRGGVGARTAAGRRFTRLVRIGGGVGARIAAGRDRSGGARAMGGTDSQATPESVAELLNPFVVARLPVIHARASPVS